MRNDLTELVFILDMSGSMSDLQKDTIGGYNTLLTEQKKAEGDAFVTTVLFDDRYILLHDRKDIKEVEKITEKEYSPLGMTAMLDAVGRTINSVGQKLAALPEEERPGNVIVTIITDGYENASAEFTWAAVKKMITEQREKYSWTFTFIGANIDTMQVSDNLGIDRKLAKSYTANTAGTSTLYSTVSKSYSKTRKKYSEASANMSFAEAAMMRAEVEDEISEDLDELK